MAEYKGKYRLEEKRCEGCSVLKKIPTRNRYCSRTCRKGVKLAAVANTTGELKIVLIDIETFPIEGRAWGTYETNLLEVLRPTIICCFSAKVLGGKQITIALSDFDLYKTDPFDDSELMKALFDVLDGADIVIAHNGDRFDIRKINARLIHHGMKPPSPYKTIDTLKVSRRYFGMDSHKLNEIGKFLLIGEKLKTGGYQLWSDCMAGVKTAWKRMKEYNALDVLLLEKVYLSYRPWMTGHPNVNVNGEGGHRCPKCGSAKMQKRGTAISTTGGRYTRAQCQSCGGWAKFPANLNPKGTKVLSNI
jgi:DNA polymerase elongation subunit (family B)